jgi:hypothetical protein
MPIRKATLRVVERVRRIDIQKAADVTSAVAVVVVAFTRHERVRQNVGRVATAVQLAAKAAGQR